MGSIAAGGRYDNLVGMFSVSNSQTPCVGVSIGIERVFRIMEERILQTNALQQQSNIDVYIASIGSGLLVERMKLAKVFWGENISAEYSHLENPKFKRQLDHALGSNIPVMVVIGESELENGTVKVKDMKGHTEVEVPLAEVVSAVLTAGARRINAGADLELLDVLR
jgi:histidyl-tRNA synthetase